MHNLFRVFITLFTLFFGLHLQVEASVSVSDTTIEVNEKCENLLYQSAQLLPDSPDKALQYAAAALTLSKQLNDSSLIVKAYIQMSISSASLKACDESEFYFFTGIQYATTPKDSLDFYSEMGMAYTYCNNYKNALKCYEIAYKIVSQFNDKQTLGQILIKTGETHVRLANYYHASEKYLEAQEIMEGINDKESIAIIFKNMGEVMALQNQYDKAVGYYLSALLYFEELDLQAQCASTFLNLGQIYITQKQWDVAKHYLNKSYIIDTTNNFKNYESVALKLLGITYLKTDKLTSAERLIEEAVRIQKEYGYNDLIWQSSIILAEVYHEQHKTERALNTILEVERQIFNGADDKSLEEALKLKSLLLEELGRYEPAYFALKESRKLHDSIFNIEKSKSIMNLELAYQTEKKEKLIDVLKYNDNLQHEQLEKRQVFIYLLIVSIALLVFSILFLFFYWKKRQQTENQEREQRFLRGRFEAEERAKDKIALELHDDIGGRLIGIIMQLQNSQNLTEGELKLLQTVYGDVRRLSHSLNEPLFSSITLQELTKNYLSELKESTSFTTQFIDDFKPDWQTISGQQELQRHIYRIIQELITNTIKYAEATEVEIQMISQGNNFVLIYEDNGKGIPEEEISNNLNFTTISKRIEMFNGTFEINSHAGDGLFVMVTIPFSYLKIKS